MLTADDKLEIRRLVDDVLHQREDLARNAHTSLPAVECIADVAARATEVFGDRERAMRWLRAPVRGLNGRTPISVLSEQDGATQVIDILGRIEHGIW